MITGFFLSVLLTLVGFVVGLLPVIALPSQIPSSFAMIWGYVNLFSMVVPVGTIVTLLGLVVVYESASMVWRLLMWIMRKIPGIN